jgi:hypothetical protein
MIIEGIMISIAMAIVLGVCVMPRRKYAKQPRHDEVFQEVCVRFGCRF